MPLPLRLRRFLPIAILIALPDAAMAQASGRWMMTLTGGVPPRIRGELRLTERGPALSGTLLLEFTDSLPTPLHEARLARDGGIAFTLQGADPVRFVGRVAGDEMRGEATGGVGGTQQWVASRIDERVEYYPSLPRFRLRQIVVVGNDSISRLPGAWLAAAEAGGHTTAAVIADQARIARAAGLVSLDQDDTASADGFTALLGGGRRAEVVAASRRTLGAIAAGIPDPAVRARFDRLFRPRGQWLVDLADAALARAQMRFGGVTWAAAGPALDAIGWLPAGAGEDAVPLAVYRLWTLGEQDTSALRTAQVAMRRAAPESELAVTALLGGYGDAVAWHADAIRFFLAEPWIPDGGRGRSLADEVRAFWQLDSLPVPAIGHRRFGYPQAVPRFGVPPALFDQLVVAENWSGSEWLRRHGSASLLQALRRLPADSGGRAVLDLGGQAIRLSTVPRQAEESLNGFLEPRDAIVLEPSYMPLLALATVVHEWQHLLFHHARYRNGGPPAAGFDTATVVLPTPDPFVTEGLAEWATDEILRPLVARHPLLALGEGTKRARMARLSPGDPHLVGYLLVRALADVEQDRAALLALLVEASTDPRRVAAAPVPRQAWRAHAGVPDRVLRAPAMPVLFPETRFTLEHNFPDVLGTRIVVPR